MVKIHKKHLIKMTTYKPTPSVNFKELLVCVYHCAQLWGTI